jgi:pilus assembly protein CpaB
MRLRLALIGVALVLGVVAAVAAASYLNGAKRQIDAEKEQVEVLVATKECAKGSPVSELVASGAVAARKVPRRYVVEGAISSPRAVDGQVLGVALSPGQQLAEDWFKYSIDAGLSYSIPEGQVALTIPSNEIKGVAGLIKPGDHVIVIATFSPGEDGDDVTRILLKKVRVLAVGKSVGVEKDRDGTEAKGVVASSEQTEERSSSRTSAGSITLALNGTDAQKVVFAEEKGKVWLGLLSTGGVPPVEVPGVNLQTVFR